LKNLCCNIHRFETEATSLAEKNNQFRTEKVSFCRKNDSSELAVMM